MTKVNVISGFLGAGKTTFIKELLEKVFKGKQIVLIENEFGEIGIDSGFLREAGIQITEMNSGCICCSLVGDFTVALGQVVEQFHPERILIEPSGVGKLSDVEKAVSSVSAKGIELDTGITVVDAKKARKYRKNFGEFFEDQVKYADTIVLSRTSDIDEEVLAECVRMLRELNDKAPIVTTPWDLLTADVLQKALDDKYRIEDLIATEEELLHHHHHHHHHDHDEEEHEHHHHHDEDDDDDDEDEHEHHHHHDEDEEHEHHHHHHDEDEDDDDDDEDEHEHHHHHDHVEHEHHHHHHHHDHDHDHDADEIFDSVGTETVHKYDRAELEEILQKLAHTEEYGEILRAKGIVALNDGTWAEFDLVPGEVELRGCTPDYTGKICVIGAELKKAEVIKAFHL